MAIYKIFIHDGEFKDSFHTNFKFENFENKQEILIEKYNVSLKNSKSIDEPKLSFTQENIFEKDRIVKIIYTDHILSKTKIHELKYEFYD